MPNPDADDVVEAGLVVLLVLIELEDAVGNIDGENDHGCWLL